MTSPSKYEIPAASEWLPTLPTVGLKLMEMFADEDVAIVQIAKEVKVDPVLTAKLLHIANSPLYRSKSEILSIEHAVSWLGKTEVAGLVLSMSLSKFAPKDEKHERLFNNYWRQSFIQGCAMTRLAESTGQIQQGEGYICGLLMDLGRLLLIDANPDGYLETVQESRRTGTPLHEVELRYMGRSHSQIGEELLNCMGLPERFSKVAGLHTIHPDELEKHVDDEHFMLLAAAVASSSLGDFFCRNNQAESLSRMESICRSHLRMSESDLQLLLESVNNDVNSKGDSYSVDVKSMVPMGQLIGHTMGQIPTGSSPANAPTTTVASVPNEQTEELETLRRLVANMEERACRDSMTGVHNRDYYTAMLNERVKCERFGKDQFAMLVIDIDKFKSINDGFGHLTGDFAITWTARYIDSFFKHDLVARYGGDEFVAIVEYETVEELETRLEQLCREVHEQGAAAAKLPVPLTISIGGVACEIDRPYPSLSSKIFQLADEAMYEAKNQGGNRGKIVSLYNGPESVVPAPATVSQNASPSPVSQ